MPAYYGKALPLPICIKKDAKAYTCSLNVTGDIVFTLNHVHYNLSSSYMVKLWTFAYEYNMLVLSANYITF